LHALLSRKQRWIGGAVLANLQRKCKRDPLDGWMGMLHAALLLYLHCTRKQGKNPPSTALHWDQGHQFILNLVCEKKRCMPAGLKKMHAW